MKTTWKPHEKHGHLTMQSDLPHSVYAFPKQRKEPLTDARHVRNAVARFDQVIHASDADRALAFANIRKAAKHYGVQLSEGSWLELGVRPQKARRATAKRGAATPKRKNGPQGRRKKARRKPARTRSKGAGPRGRSGRVSPGKRS